MSLWTQSAQSIRLFTEKQFGGISYKWKRHRRTEQLETIVRNALKNVPLEVYLFAGTAILYCAFRKLCNYQSDNSGNGDSSNSEPRKRLTAKELEWEAKIHAQKKQSNYKDPSLQAVMSAMSVVLKSLLAVSKPFPPYRRLPSRYH